MGGDGGSIPTRTDLVKEPRKRKYKDKVMNRVAKWTTCAISENKLREPVMGCALGHLYNKEAVIETILLKKQTEETFHIKKLRDLKELKLTKNPSYDPSKSEVNNEDNYPFVCPLSGITMNGNQKFGFFWKCGCVLTEKSIKTINQKNCPNCNSEADIKDFILINHMVESVEKSLLEHEERLKKATKIKTKSESKDKIPEELFAKKTKIPHQIKPNSSIKQDELKNVELNKVTTRPSNTKDPNQSSTYKSLFTSSEDYQQQQLSKKPNFWATSFSYHL